MGRILLICGYYPVYEKGVYRGKEFCVSHGINMSTDEIVILPNAHPLNLGGKYDKDLCEWVIG